MRKSKWHIPKLIYTFPKTEGGIMESIHFVGKMHMIWKTFREDSELIFTEAKNDEKFLTKDYATVKFFAKKFCAVGDRMFQDIEYLLYRNPHLVQQNDFTRIKTQNLCQEYCHKFLNAASIHEPGEIERILSHDASKPQNESLPEVTALHLCISVRE